MTKLRILVLASGNGSNFSAIHKACEEGKVQGSVVGVVSNRLGGPILGRAYSAGVSCMLNRSKSSAYLLRLMERFSANLVVCAGYDRILLPEIIDHFHGVFRPDQPGIINIHPADTKAYQGLYGYEYALGLLPGTKRLTETKITVHYVDYGVDTGPIIEQATVPIAQDDTLQTLRSKGLKIEHDLYPKCIELYRTAWTKEVV